MFYRANLCAHAPCHASRSSCLNFGSVWLPLSHGLLGPATRTKHRVNVVSLSRELCGAVLTCKVHYGHVRIASR